MEQATEPNFIGTLGLNWKLFIAQLINFGIVLFILWKWIFKPIAQALEARRLRIEESVRAAQNLEKRIKEFEQNKEKRFKEARREADEIMRKAMLETEKVKQEIIDNARKEADKILKEVEITIEAEKKEMLQAIRQEAADLTIMTAEKVLRKKLDKEQDKILVQEVLKSIR